MTDANLMDADCIHGCVWYGCVICMAEMNDALLSESNCWIRVFSADEMKRAFLAGFACSDDTHNGVVTYPEDGSDIMQSLDDTFAGFIKGLKTDG